LAITVDGAGNVYIAGTTDGLLPITANAATSTSTSGGFIAKLSADGSKFLYVTYLAPVGGVPSAIAVDPDGNAYVAGSTAGNIEHVWVTKLSADGSSFLYTKQLAGSRNDSPFAITVDSSGNATVAGVTSSPDFPIAGAPVQPALAGTQNAFVARLDNAGNLVFSTFLGGSGLDSASAIRVDSDGNIYIAGSTTSLDFPTTPGTFQPAPLVPLWSLSPGGFVTKLTPNASLILYSTYIPALNQPGFGLEMALGSSGDIFLGGTTGAAFPVTPSAPQPCSTLSDRNTFVAHLDSNGALQDATYYPGKLGAITASANGTVLLADPTATLARITFFAPGSSAPACLSTGAFNSASLLPEYGVVPGELVTLTGFGIGPDQGVSYTPDAEGNAPFSLSGVQVLFNGVPVPIFYAQSRQVNVQAPVGLSDSQSKVTVSVIYKGAVIDSTTFPVADGNPGFFRLQPGVSAQAYALNQDGTFNSATNPAPRGSVIALWGTGFGVPEPSCPTGGLNFYEADSLPTSAAVFVLSGGNGTLPVTYAGSAPTLACGIVQVNVQIGQNVSPGPVTITPLLYSNYGSNGQTPYGGGPYGSTIIYVK
jgi:uncharacterized protein (TIGR03437 family)